MLTFAKKIQAYEKNDSIRRMDFALDNCFLPAFSDLQKQCNDSGDSVISREIQYVSPGNAGSDQIWDFSKIQYTGKNLVCNMSTTSAQELKDVGTYNVVSTEDGLLILVT